MKLQWVESQKKDEWLPVALGEGPTGMTAAGDFPCSGQASEPVRGGSCQCANLTELCTSKRESTHWGLLS